MDGGWRIRGPYAIAARLPGGHVGRFRAHLGRSKGGNGSNEPPAVEHDLRANGRAGGLRLGLGHDLAASLVAKGGCLRKAIKDEPFGKSKPDLLRLGPRS
jgi:hypothetical protein